MTGQAVQYVRKNKRKIILNFASTDLYPPEENPISIFMAGSPGAGKTELSKQLIEPFVNKPVRIDADEIRQQIRTALIINTTDTQIACNEVVNNLYNHALKHQQSLVLDGTFAYSQSINNINKSLKGNRRVEMYYIYQEPVLSWQFTKQREVIERREVPKEVFINAFLKAQDNVNAAKQEFGNQIILNVVIKNFQNGLEKLHLNVNDVKNYLPQQYQRPELERIIV